MDFIRITLDKTNDIGTYIVERFKPVCPLHDKDISTRISDEWSIYEGMTLRYDPTKYESTIYGMVSRWTFQEGTFLAIPETREVRVTKTAFIMPSEENDAAITEVAIDFNGNLVDPTSNRVFRSFGSTIKDLQKNIDSLYYRAPETFDWTDKCVAVYDTLLRATVPLSPVNIGIRITDRFGLGVCYATLKEIEGMLQEMEATADHIVYRSMTCNNAWVAKK